MIWWIVGYLVASYLLNWTVIGLTDRHFGRGDPVPTLMLLLLSPVTWIPTALVLASLVIERIVNIQSIDDFLFYPWRR